MKYILLQTQRYEDSFDNKRFLAVRRGFRPICAACKDVENGDRRCRRGGSEARGAGIVAVTRIGQRLDAELG